MAGEVIGVQGVRITDLPEAEAVVDSNYMILVDELTGRTYKVKREHIKAQKTSELVDDVGFLRAIPDEYMTESEVREFTETEIAQIREVLNTWTSFKNNGGKINGDIEIEKHLANLKIGDSFNIKTYDQRTDLSSDWYKAIILRVRSNASDTASYVRLNGVNFAGDGNISLGEESTPWTDIYLKGVSKSDNGYTKLPNGLIMQWGLYHCSGGLDTGVYTIQFPITFPNKVLNCVTSVGGFSEHEANGITNSKIIEWYNSNFKIKVYKTDKYVGVNTTWIAIGY